MLAVIMAGGQGTRISSLFPDIPKPLVPIDGVPVLQREIEELRDQGITEIILTVSHRAFQIISTLGDGSSMGVHLSYYIEETPMGNTGALFKIRDRLRETFLLLTADNVFDVDFHRMVEFHHQKHALVTILARPTSHPYDCGLLETDEDGSISHWYVREDPRPRFYRNRINSGIHLIEPSVLDMIGVDAEKVGELDPETGEYYKVDLDRQFLRPMCGTHRMFSFYTLEYCRDMGTPERYESVCRDFATGVFEARRRGKKKKAIFLPLNAIIKVSGQGGAELWPGASEAIRTINRSPYYAAAFHLPDMPPEEGRELLYAETETLLGESGAFLDGLFDGKKAGAARSADAAKRENGKLLSSWLKSRAEKELDVDLQHSWMIAATDAEIRAGRGTGCRIASLPFSGQESLKTGNFGASLRTTVSMILRDPARSLQSASGF